ncbi:MAG: cellulase family glycosylhydrolase [Ignavibacteriae bacterium]|nr:cellulase family glycosylhydrolase [Ignavibacteriota bacterium]
MSTNFYFTKSLKRIFIEKKYFIFFLSLCINSQIFSQLPTATEIASKMTFGWNIGNSLEVPGGETGWGNPVVSQILIDSVKNAGFNTVRIPCSWDSHANQTNLEIDQNWLARVNEVIDYCYNNQMYVIINVHWDGGWLENNVTAAMQDAVNKKQQAYWTQIANYFKDYDEHLLFASANEPKVDNATQMSVLLSYHQTFIDAVRASGGNNSSRVLVIQGPSTDIDKTNKLMTTLPSDSLEDHLMVEIHYYTPWNFCGLEKDESWGKMFYFWGKDFHSTNNTTRNATWGEETAIETYFKSMKTKFVDKNIPVILGEYSAIKRTSLSGEDLALHIASREYYYQYIANAAIRFGMIPIYWDDGYSGVNGMALFNRNNGSVVDKGAIDAIKRGVDLSTSVKEKESTEINAEVEYITALPNPVSSSTKIQFYLKDNSDLNVYVYNVLGQEVASFKNLNFNEGLHSVIWQPNRAASGTYFINVNIGKKLFTKKVLVVH